jgi:hypothetical protein
VLDLRASRGDVKLLRHGAPHRGVRLNSVDLAVAALAVLLMGCAPTTESDSAMPDSASAMPAAFESGAPYAPPIEPAEFTTAVDNPFFPLAPGARWMLNGSGEADGEVDTIEVLAETRTVMGVECVVVHDVVALDGEPVEVTDDWYAQDTAGNVWYFGEETAEYEGGEVVSTAGSWEAGVDGAQPGIIMPADPQIGVTYRQEYYAGEAEDLAQAVARGERAETPGSVFDDVLVTEDWTPLEPDVRERKFYARDIGLVMERQVAGGDAVFELAQFTAP